MVGLPAVAAVLAVQIHRTSDLRWAGQIVVDVAFVTCMCIAATLLHRERRHRGTAALLGTAAICFLLGWSGLGVPDWLSYLGAVLTPAWWAILGWAVLRYPVDRLEEATERRFVVVAVLWLTAGHGLLNLFRSAVYASKIDGADTAHMWWPTVVESRSVSAIASTALTVGDGVLAVYYLVLLQRRLRRLSGVDRWALAPMLASLCTVIVLLVLKIPATAGPPTSLRVVVSTLSDAVLMAVPVAFVLAWVRQRFARANVAEVVSTLTSSSTAEDVSLALRAGLRDPSLEVAFWVPETCQYVNETGRPAGNGPDSASRLYLPIADSDEKQIAVITADPRLRYQPELVESALSAARLALDNARLKAALRAQLDDARASRRRLAETAVSERRRLERDLHDGVQQRILALTLQLAQMQAHGSSSDEVIDSTRAELRETLRELRNLASGIHPPVLAQGGLAAALDDLLDRLPFPVILDVCETRCAAAAELTAYYVASEALSNMVKHAQANTASITARIVNQYLNLAITDDGVGGATRRPGGGLAGLTDRVAALGGTLVIESPASGGTTIRVRLPCE
jgi:signal transduction histidine kinase